MSQHQIVNLFVINGQQYAIPVIFITRAVRAVEITPVPNAPETLMGVILYHGQILPVLNFRYILRIPEKEIDIDDRILILDIQGKQIAIVADLLIDIISLNTEHPVLPDPVLFHPDIKQIIHIDNSIVFLVDIVNFVKHCDEQILERLINETDFTSAT